MDELNNKLKNSYKLLPENRLKLTSDQYKSLGAHQFWYSNKVKPLLDMLSLDKDKRTNIINKAKCELSNIFTEDNIKSLLKEGDEGLFWNDKYEGMSYLEVDYFDLNDFNKYIKGHEYIDNEEGDDITIHSFCNNLLDYILFKGEEADSDSNESNYYFTLNKSEKISFIFECLKCELIDLIGKTIIDESELITSPTSDSGCGESIYKHPLIGYIKTGYSGQGGYPDQLMLGYSEGFSIDKLYLGEFRKYIENFDTSKYEIIRINC